MAHVGRGIRAALLGIAFGGSVAADGAGVNARRRCTMGPVYGRPTYPAEMFVVLGGTTGRVAIDTLGLKGAPEPASPGFLARAAGGPPERVRAWEWRIENVPDTVRKQYRSVLAQNGGSIWVVPWERGTDCILHQDSYGSDSGAVRGLLFGTLRPVAGWIDGAPTIDVVNGIPGPYPVYSRTVRADANHPSDDELRTFLKLYKYVVGDLTDARDSAFMAWATAHRDSAMTRPLSGMVVSIFNGENRRRLSTIGVASHAGVWRMRLVTALGDTADRWMRISRHIENAQWLGASGQLKRYSDVIWDSIPPPVQYASRVVLANSRAEVPSEDSSPDPKRVSTIEMWEFRTSPGAAVTTPRWLWLVPFVSPDHRRLYTHLDSLRDATVRSPRTRAAGLTQFLRMPESGSLDTLTRRPDIIRHACRPLGGRTRPPRGWATSLTFGVSE